MTEKQPKHPFLRSLPLAALAAGVIATACDVAGEGEPGGSLSTEAIAPAVESVAVPASEPVDPTRGSLGIDGMSWPEGTGPRPGDGAPIPPTRHPFVAVEEGGSAWRAGLRDGDVLLAVNGRDSREMVRHFPDLTPGTRYRVRVRRGEAERDLTLEVGPAAGAAAVASAGARGGARAAYAVDVLDEKPTFSNRRKIESEMERLYPRTLQDAGIGGTVLTAFVIERDGRVDMSSVKVIDSPHQELSDATVATVRSFRFNPGRYQGESVRVQVEMPITWAPAG